VSARKRLDVERAWIVEAASVTGSARLVAIAQSGPEEAGQAWADAVVAAQSLIRLFADASVDADLRLCGFDADETYPEHGHEALRSAYRAGLAAAFNHPTPGSIR
jgi:hypothetical protein